MAPGTRSDAAARRRQYTTGDAELDGKLRELAAELGAADVDITYEILVSAARLAHEPVSRLDRKIVNAALKEMRYAFNVFERYPDVRKVSVFGSSRVDADDREYETAREFGRLMAERGWMVVTGAGGGIMRAGNEGAGAESSFGVNIVLPMESGPNEFIADNAKLINFKYFFTRKLMFMKEADAFVLCPGGFGTMDEAFELLTLVQTGKSDLHPIVLLESEGGGFWKPFEDHLRKDLMARGYIDADDLSLYRRCDTPEAAADEIASFYRVYHSQRYVGKTLVLRLNRKVSDADLKVLSTDFGDILRGPIRRTGPSKAEIHDDDATDLPRLALDFDRAHFARLRQLIDRLNRVR